MHQLRNLSLGLALAVAIAGPGMTKATAQAGDTKPAKPAGGQMESFISPKVVDQLNLTAEQQTKYTDLKTQYAADAEKWMKANNFDPAKYRQDMQAARQAKDRAKVQELQAQAKPLNELRTQYLDKFKALLTDEQKTKLQEASGGRRGTGGHGARNKQS